MSIGTRFRKDKETLVYDEVSFTIRSDEEEENIYISGSNCSGDGSSTSILSIVDSSDGASVGFNTGA